MFQVLPSELVSGIQDHVDAWCLAVSKHALEDDLYVSWIFLVPSLCNDSVSLPSFVCKQSSINTEEGLENGQHLEFSWSLSEL